MNRIEPSLNRPTATPHRVVTRRGSAAGRNAAITIAVIVILIGLGWLLWRAMYPHSAPPPAAPAAAPVAAAPAPEAPAAPSGPLHPIEAMPSAAPSAEPLPTLADSDAAMKDAIAGVLGKAGGEDVFELGGIIPRFVATIDNLPRKTASVRKLPVRPAAGTLAVQHSGSGIVLSESNASRYAPYMTVLEAVNTQRLVSIYVHFYPLFQQAYVDLGYPGKYFNDRLIVAIDDLLAAPEPSGPVALLQPKIVYTFADPQFEAMSAGQKIMVRIGLANELRVKAKLREIRHALIGNPPPR